MTWRPPLREPPPELDADLRPADIADALRQMTFERDDELKPIRVDRGVRDFLVASLARHAARRD